MTDMPITGKSDPDRISVELSSRRTGMSFQRTRMSADRTLMSVIRTSLSLMSAIPDFDAGLTKERGSDFDGDLAMLRYCKTRRRAACGHGRRRRCNGQTDLRRMQ